MAVVLVGGGVGLTLSGGPASADTSDQERLVLQERLQRQAEMAALLSEVARVRHETAMSVINNIR